MLLNIWRVYQDIIQIYQDALIQQIKQYFIHNPLKCRWRIAKSKGHNGKFELAISSTESCLITILFKHRDLVISIT